MEVTIALRLARLGPLAAVALFVPHATCAGLMDWEPMAGLIAGGGALLAGGLVCRYYGRKWNQGTGYHMTYGLPLEIWGWIYIVVGGLFSVLAMAALIKMAMVG